MKSNYYQLQQQQLEQAKKTAQTKLTQQQRSNINNIVEKGKKLQEKMQNAQEELSQHLSDNNSFKNQDTSNIKQNGEFTKNFIPNNGGTVIIPKQNYQIQAQQAKVQLDGIQSQLLHKKSNSHQKKQRKQELLLLQQLQGQNKNNNQDKELNQEVELLPVQFININIQNIKFLSKQKFTELPDSSFTVQISTDSQGIIEQFKVNLYQKEQQQLKNFSQKLCNIVILSEDDQKQTYMLNINKQITIPYIEGDGIQFKISNSQYTLDQKYPLICKSPYQQLVLNQQKYFINQQDVEFLDSFYNNKPLIQIFSKSKQIMVDEDRIQLNDIVPVLLSCQLLVSANQSMFSNNFEPIQQQRNQLFQQLLNNEKLFEEKMKTKQVQQKQVQTEMSEVNVQNLQNVNQTNNLYYNEDDNSYYSLQKEKQEVQQNTSANNIQQQQIQQINNANENNVKVEPGMDQLNKMRSQISNVLKQTLYQDNNYQTEQSILQPTPCITIKKIEIDCLPERVQYINSVNVKFDGKVINICDQQPIVAGHLILTNLLINIPIQKFHVSPLIIQVDNLTAYISLQSLKNQAVLETWTALKQGDGVEKGRFFVKLQCIPPISLSKNCDTYKFLNENGEIVDQQINYQPHHAFNAVVDQYNNQTVKLTASQIAKMYQNQNAQKEVIKQDVIQYNNNNTKQNNDIEEITRQLNQLTSNLSMNSSFNVSVGHESAKVELQREQLNNDVQIDEDDKSLNTSSVIEAKIESITKQSQRKQSQVNDQMAHNIEYLNMSRKINQTKQKISQNNTQSASLTNKQIVQQVKKSRNEKLASKYDISDSDSDCDKNNKPNKVSVNQSTKTGCNVQWLKEQAKKLFNDESDESSDI